MSQELIEAALRAYDLGALHAFTHHSGTAAKTWRVVTAAGTYLLRTRGSRTAAPELVAFDHALRRHLLAAGIPTAAPIATRDGATCTRVGDLALELYAIVPGQALAHAGLPEVRAAARALAAFHRAGRDFALAQTLPPVAQYRTLGLDTASTRMESPALLRQIYERLADSPGAEAFSAGLSTARRWLERLNREFDEAAYVALPQTLTHGDYTLANLLFLDGRVNGIFDFDWARWAARVRDLADGLFFIAGERRTPLRPDDIRSLTEPVELHPLRLRAWLQSYQEDTPLEDRELDAIPMALAARWLSIRVEGMAKVPAAERLDFALGPVAAPLVWLEEHWDRLRAGLPTARARQSRRRSRGWHP